MRAKILVADDHAVLRRSLRSTFDGSGDDWEICGEAADGRQAVEMAAKLKPNLIILDLAMPVMDGLAAARELHRLLPDTPLLMYTMHASTQLEVEARKAGIHKVVPKSSSAEIMAAARATLREMPVAQDDHPPPQPNGGVVEPPREKAVAQSANGDASGKSTSD